MTVTEINEPRCRHCQGPVEDPESWICEKCFAFASEPFVFAERAPAKSSASALACGACQGCGCPLDGRPRNPECDCPCHG